MSKFRARFTTETYNCPCGQTLISRSGKEMNMKLRLHSYYCSKILDVKSEDIKGYNECKVIGGNYVDASRKADKVFDPHKR